MVVHARDSAFAFCDVLLLPHLSLRPPATCLASREHLALSLSMDEWLVAISNPKFLPRWTVLADVYKRAVRDSRGEEHSLLEEIARRVVKRVLHFLIDVHRTFDPTCSKLAEFTPAITFTQSLRIPANFTFH